MCPQVVKISLSPTGCRTSALTQTLDKQETERAQRFRFDHLRKRFVAAHAALRQILAAHLECDPQRIEYELGAFGKPRVASANGSYLRFNMSHSNDLALVAIAYGREVGIDVESVDREINHRALARRHFSAAEIERLEDEPPATRPELFFSLWTGKEAYLKARGTGLTMSLDEFQIVESKHRHSWRDVIERTHQSPRWFVRELSPQPGFIASIALEERSARLDLQEWIW
jgi:4'-phosphopantetheinyl transferase